VQNLIKSRKNFFCMQCSECSYQWRDPVMRFCGRCGNPLSIFSSSSSTESSSSSSSSLALPSLSSSKTISFEEMVLSPYFQKEDTKIKDEKIIKEKEKKNKNSNLDHARKRRKVIKDKQIISKKKLSKHSSDENLNSESDNEKGSKESLNPLMSIPLNRHTSPGTELGDILAELRILPAPSNTNNSITSQLTPPTGPGPGTILIGNEGGSSRNDSKRNTSNNTETRPCKHRYLICRQHLCHHICCMKSRSNANVINEKVKSKKRGLKSQLKRRRRASAIASYDSAASPPPSPPPSSSSSASSSSSLSSFPISVNNINNPKKNKTKIKIKKKNLNTQESDNEISTSSKSIPMDETTSNTHSNIIGKKKLAAGKLLTGHGVICGECKLAATESTPVYDLPSWGGRLCVDCQYNALISKSMAIKNYGLRTKDLEQLPFHTKPNPFNKYFEPMKLYTRVEVEELAIEKWGSLDACSGRRRKTVSRKGSKPQRRSERLKDKNDNEENTNTTTTNNHEEDDEDTEIDNISQELEKQELTTTTTTTTTITTTHQTRRKKQQQNRDKNKRNDSVSDPKLTTKKGFIDSSDSDLPLSAFQQQQQEQSSSSSSSSTSKPMVLLPSKDKALLPVIESEDESDFPLSRLKKRAERRKNKREKQISLNKDSSKMDISPGISVRVHNSNKKQNNKKNNANSNKRSGKRKNKTLQVRATETENSAGDEGDNEEEDQ